jgi:hypothetical protein
MASQYGEYTRPDGDTAILLADTLSRAKFERKGFTYVGPAQTTPGLEPANPGRDGETTQAVSEMDATAVVQQAADVVMRKLSGTWTLEEAAAESADTRTKMAELGSFPLAALDAPGESAVPTAPLPAPVQPVPGATVSLTGEGENAIPAPVTTGSVGSVTPAPTGTDGAATDGATQAGAQDLSNVSTAPAGTNWANTTSTAGAPGTFTGTSPTLKGELDQTQPEPRTAWTEGQHVRVNSRDYYWDGNAWVMGRAPAPATTTA